MTPRPVLDRRKHFDPKSRSFGISRAETVVIKPKLWDPPYYRTDQGQEGHCVGFGWGNELASSPIRTGLNTDEFSHGLFYAAQAIDRSEGRQFAEGATVLAGAKAVKGAGFMDEYRWAFSLTDIVRGLLLEGPCVIGVDWTPSMYETRPSGLMDISDEPIGGHCAVLVGYHPRMRIAGEGWTKRHEVFVLLNSWGPRFGRKGLAYITAEDMANKLMPNGEFCFPINRKKVRS